MGRTQPEGVAITDTVDSAAEAVDPCSVPRYRLLARGFAALRIFTGLVWLSNALAKVFDVGSYFAPKKA